MRTAPQACFPLVPIAALIAACAAPSAPSPGGEEQLMAARNRLVADVRTCSQQHGYDPSSVTGIGEKELAPQELKWRQCSYDAARRYIETNPEMRGRIEQLIAEDIQMTSAIQQGTMTRSERRTRIEELIGQLRQAQQAQISAAGTERERQAQQVSDVVDGFRGFAY
jgi:hypothetical protein